jgi:hypothetical protein
MMTCLVDYVGGYAVAVYFVALVAMTNTEVRMPLWHARIVCLLLAIQMMPKGFPLKFWSAEPAGPVPTFTSLLGGSTSFCILAIIALSLIKQSGKSRG